MKLDKEFLAKVEGPINSVWQEIAYDASALGGRMSNSGNMELVLDADRLEMCRKGGAEANALIYEAIKEHGWGKVSRFLCKHIKLGL